MFFGGGDKKKVSLKGINDKDSSRDDLLSNLKRKREEAKNLKEKNIAITKIQKFYLKHKSKREEKEKIRIKFDKFDTKRLEKKKNFYISFKS